MRVISRRMAFSTSWLRVRSFSNATLLACFHITGESLMEMVTRLGRRPDSTKNVSNRAPDTCLVDDEFGALYWRTSQHVGNTLNDRRVTHA